MIEGVLISYQTRFPLCPPDINPMLGFCHNLFITVAQQLITEVAKAFKDTGSD
jgi:hypothetical protein